MAVQLAGYKVKCMLAEPKGKRTYIDTSWSDPASPLSQQVSSNPNGTAFVSLIKITAYLHPWLLQSTRMEGYHLYNGSGAAMSPVGTGECIVCSMWVPVCTSTCCRKHVQTVSRHSTPAMNFKPKLQLHNVPQTEAHLPCR